MLAGAILCGIEEVLWWCWVIGRRRALADLSHSLRIRLRRLPYWIGGHLRLSFVELRLLESQKGENDVRRLGVIRLGVEAAEVLMVNIRASAKNPVPKFEFDKEVLQFPKAAVEAVFLRARLFQWARSHVEAVGLFERILEAQSVVNIPQRLHYEALEHAAASAMILADSDRARSYLLRIPSEFRNAESKATLQLIELSLEQERKR